MHLFYVLYFLFVVNIYFLLDERTWWMWWKIGYIHASWSYAKSISVDSLHKYVWALTPVKVPLCTWLSLMGRCTWWELRKTRVEWVFFYDKDGRIVCDCRQTAVVFSWWHDAIWAVATASGIKALQRKHARSQAPEKNLDWNPLDSIRSCTSNGRWIVSCVANDSHVGGWATRGLIWATLPNQEGNWCCSRCWQLVAPIAGDMPISFMCSWHFARNNGIPIMYITGHKYCHPLLAETLDPTLMKASQLIENNLPFDWLLQNNSFDLW